MPGIALYQPDIPQNTGAILRLGACLGLTVHIIGPTGFTLTDKALRRAGMDYIDSAGLKQHVSWTAFCAAMAERNGRLVLATTRSDLGYTTFQFQEDDVILFGRESAGVPDNVHDRADARITIPMRPGMRSLNVALSAAMIAGEALRQTGPVPQHPSPC